MSTDPTSEELASDRKNYYDKWHKFATDEVKKTEEEDEKEKQEASKALGLDKAIRSEAEKQDKDKFAALKEAKKQWDERKLSEAAQKHIISDLEDITRNFDSVKLHWKPVICFKNNKNCNFNLPSDDALKHKIVKVFVENCENCVFHLESSLVTHHLEISHSKGLEIHIKERLATIQIDVCNGVKLVYHKNFMHTHLQRNVDLQDEKHQISTIETKIFHAAVENLDLEYPEYNLSHKFSYKDAVDGEEKRPKEVQFITRFDHKKNEIVTEKVIRDAGNLPTTQDEIRNQNLTPKDALREAEQKKEGGNEAFKEKNYAQAAIFYTEAIDIIENVLDLDSEDLDKFKVQLQEKAAEVAECSFYHVCFANRAFCWQKLGHHEKAEPDAKRCTVLKPDYTKGWFRLGLSLHAQKKYFDAGKVLQKAHDLEPKNEQIKQALGFAEIQMRKMMQQR